jgi:hypothetical protein
MQQYLPTKQQNKSTFPRSQTVTTNHRTRYEKKEDQSMPMYPGTAMAIIEPGTAIDRCSDEMSAFRKNPIQSNSHQLLLSRFKGVAGFVVRSQLLFHPVQTASIH